MEVGMYTCSLYTCNRSRAQEMGGMSMEKEGRE